MVTAWRYGQAVRVVAREAGDETVRYGLIGGWAHRPKRRVVRYFVRGESDSTHYLQSYIPHPLQVGGNAVTILHVSAISGDEYAAATQAVTQVVAAVASVPDGPASAPDGPASAPRVNQTTKRFVHEPYRAVHGHVERDDSFERLFDTSTGEDSAYPQDALVVPARAGEHVPLAAVDDATVEDLEDELRTLEGDDAAEGLALLAQHFQMGQRRCIPPLAQIRGCDLVELASMSEIVAPELTLRGYAKTTRAAHRGALRLLTSMPLVLGQLPMGQALVAYVSALARSRKWRATTKARNMSSISGALRLLPIYRNVETGVEIGQDATWRAAALAADSAAKSEVPRTPKALSYECILGAMRREAMLQRRVVLAIAWACCARVGDVLQLKAEDVQLKEAELRVTWRRSKTLRHRGQYTIVVMIPLEWADMIRRWTASRPGWLFPREMTTADILQTLRRQDPRAECRGIRRGALQTLACTGAPEHILLLFSGHLSSKTLRRYLNYGSEGLLEVKQMTDAGRCLFKGATATAQC